MPPDRGLVGPEALCEFFVDQDHRWAVRRIVVLKEAALTQRDFHRPEIVHSSYTLIYLQFLAGRRCESFHFDRSPTQARSKRERCHTAHSFHPGQMSDP